MNEDQFSVRSVLAEMVDGQQLETTGPDEFLIDLGLDSITLIQFALKLEGKLDRRLSAQQIAALRDTPLGELDELIASWWAEQPAIPGGSGRLASEGTAGRGIGAAYQDTTSSATPCLSIAANDDAPLVSVRPFRESDRSEMAALCRETCTRPWLREMAHLLWLYQYLDQEPEACFVAEMSGRLVAYWIGSSNEPTLAKEFRTHVQRYWGEFVRLYLTRCGKTWSPQKHFWLWMVIGGAVIHSRRAFRLYNRRAELGPILGMTKVHFQISSNSQSVGVVFELAGAWLRYLAAKEVDITCLPGFPGREEGEVEASQYWRRIGYHPVRFGGWTVLIALVRSHASASDL